MTLKEFRHTHPFRPYGIYRHKGGEYLEAVSYPYCDDGKEESGPILIKARVPGDPTTMRTYRVDGEEPDLILLEALCQRDNTKFYPIHDNKFRAIICPTCRLFYPLNNANQWGTDRLLVINPIK